MGEQRNMVKQTMAEKIKLKQIVKELLFEVIRENRDLLRELMIEAMEDIYIMDAIQEGEQTEFVSSSKVLNLLRGSA